MAIIITFTIINYDGFEFNSVLSLNQFMALSDARSKFEIRFSKLSKIEDKVLSSVKL